MILKKNTMRTGFIKPCFKALSIFCVSVFLISCSGWQSHELVLRNNKKLLRPDEPIVIGRQKLIELTGQIPGDKVPVLRTSAGDDIASQVDDLDGDGLWDELAFVYTFDRRLLVKINVLFVNKEDVPVYKSRTNIRFAKQDGKGGYQEILTETMPADHSVEKTLQRYQLEGPGWENDIIGFRNYFDSRNAMDIFGKKTSRMVLDETDLNEKVAEYMTMQPWGMDILKVAGSLGAGGIGVYENDSLYRLTGAKITSYKLITEGPVRSIFTLNYEDFKAGKQVYDVKHEITIWAGMPGYKSRVWLSGFEGEKVLVSGIADMNGQKNRGNYLIGSFPFTSIWLHTTSSITKDQLGTALLFDRKDFIAAAKSPSAGSGVTETFYVKMRAYNEQPLTFYFFAGWEGQKKDYVLRGYFLNQLLKFKHRLNNPISISKE